MGKSVDVHSSSKISGKSSFAEKSNVQKSSSQGPRAGRVGTVHPTQDGSSKKGSATIINPLLQAAGILPTQPQNEQQTQPQTRFSDEANNGQRRSNNEYQKQKEQTRYLDEAVNGRANAEKKAQDKARGFSAEANDLGRYGKGNIDLRNRNTGLHDEDGNLMTVRSMSFNEDGEEILVPTIVKRDGKWTQLSDDEAIDWYHRTGEHLGKFDSVEEANQYADRLHKQQESLYASESNEKDQHADNYRSYRDEADRLTIEKTNSEGLTMEEQDEYDRRIKEAKDKAEEERKAAGIKNTKDKLDDLRSAPLLSDDEQEAWAFLGPNEDVENQVGGWGRQFASGPAMAAGTALQWFDQTSDDMVRYEYDQEHGEGAYDAAIAGKNVNQVGQLGDKIWDTGVGLRESGEQMWEAGIEDMSDLGKEIATVGKAGADLAADAALNFVMPGLGTMRMYMGAMGDASYEQSQRENNDIDSRMLSMVKAGASAYLSNKLVGDVIYGKGIIPKGIDKMLANVSPEVQKVVRPLLNSEGVQEGVENIMNWGADIILGLDTGKPLDWNEVKQDAFIGYVLGVVTNGLAGGMNIDSKKQQAIAQEAVEFAESGLTVDEAAEIGKQNTRDQVVIKAKPESETSSPAAKPAQDSTGTAWTGDWDSWVNAVLSGGALSDTDVDTIYNRPAARQAFEEATGISLDGMSEEDAKSTIGMAAGTQTIEPTTEATAEPEQNAATEPTTEPEQTAAETNANEMPSGAEPAQEANDTAGEIPNPEQANTNENAGQDETAGGQQNPNPEQPFDDRSAPGTGKEKTSQSFSNTLAPEEGDSVRDPLSYLSKSDVETTQRAMERLGMNGEAEMAAMMSKEMWNDEQVQMSNIIRKSLFADAQKSGDWKAYDTFRKVYDEHMRVIARALRQAGNYDGQSAEGIARMAGQYLDMMENNAKDDLARNPNNKKAKDDLVEIDKARQATNETAGEIGALEAEEAELIKSGMSEEEAWSKVKDRYLDLGQKLVAQRNMGLILDNILFKNARIRKGSETVNTLLRKLLSTRSPEYIRSFVRANNAGLATDATYKVHPTAKQVSSMLGSLHKMCMLFGSGTTLRNTESNVVFGALDWASNNTGGVLADSVIGLMTGNRSRGLEAGIFSGNTWKAAWDAGVESVLEIAANMDMREDGKYVTGTQAFSPYNPGTRLIARLNQVLGYALNTTDAVSYAGAQESASNASQRANSRRGGNMTDETAKAIGEGEAAFRTLKDKNVATELLTEVQQAFDLLGFGGEIQYKNVGGKKIAVGRKGGFGLGSFNVPFVGVPVNLKLKPLQYTAPGAALGAIHAAQAVKLAKGADPNSAEMQESLRLQNQAAGEIGRGVTGTAMLIALMSLLKKAKEEGKEWFKDWDLEEDKDVKAQNRAEGKFGQQINLSMLDRIRNGEDPGRWQHRDDTVDISSNEPTNSFLQMASIMADDEDAPIPEALFKALWQTEKSNLSDLPCLDAINNFRDTFNNNPVYNEATDTDEDGNLEEPTVNEWKTFLNATGAMAGSSASGFTFAPLRHYAAVKDDYQRDTTGDNALRSAWNRTLLGIPGKYGRESLPIKTDNYGNPLTNGDKKTRIKNAYLAMKYGTIQQSEVSEEVERIREETGVSLTPPRYAPKTITFGSGKDKEKVRLTAGEGKEYSTTRGQEFEQRYQELMSNPLYQNADSDTQAAMGSKLEAFAKDSAKADVAENHGIEYESQFDYAREMDDPVAFLAAQAGIAQAERDGNLDAVDMILQSVRSQNMSRQEEEAYGKHILGFDKLNYLTENGMRTERAQTFDTDLKELYESEKRTAARGSDYFRTACSGRYSPEEADAIMSYETAITQETEDNYKDRVQYNLDQAGLGNIQGTVWGWIEECADGNMTTSQFNKNLSKAGIPAKQQYEIKQVRESMTEDKHMVGKTVSGIYRAMREVGYTPEEALQFYEMCDPNYNGSYTKREFDSAVNKAFGNSSYGRQVRSLIRQYVGK